MKRIYAAIWLLALASFAAAPAWAATNQLTMSGAPSGTQPSLSANGVDSNISIILTTKGTGGVGIGTATPQTTLQVNGSIMMGTGTCASTTTGSIQYSSGAVQFCNGTSWANIASGGAVTGSQYQMAYLSATNTAIGDANITTDAGNDLIVSGGTLSIGTTTITANAINLTGQSAQTIDMLREYTASTAGKNLTISAGGAVPVGTNLAGGNLILSSGIATGTGTSNIQFQSYPAGTSGTSDTTALTALTISATGVSGTTAATTVQANAGSGTNQNGATLTLASGVSTGTGSSNINFNVYTAVGTSGSTANSPTTAVTILGNGNVIQGSGTKLATSATTGFTHIAQTNGTPAGSPTITTGSVPITVDNSGNVYAWNTGGSAWVKAGGGSPGGSTTQLQYDNAGAFGGTAGLTWNSTNQTLTLATIANPAAAALTITGGGLTGTTSYPALNITQTWNNASGTFTGIKENVTNTNSASGSLLMDLQVGGTSEQNVDKSGNGYFANSIGIGATPVSGINLYSAGSTAVFGTGEAGASPSGGTIRAPNGSGSNITGGNLTIQAGNGMGTGGSGTISFQTAAAGSVAPNVAFDAGAAATATSGTSKTVSFTVGSNSNRLLIVDVASSGDQPTGATYNGTTMTSLYPGTYWVGSSYHYVYYLTAPATGANNLVVTFSTAISEAAIGIASFYNVSQTSPLGTVSSNSAGGGGSSDALTVTSSSGNLVYESIANLTGCSTIGSGETSVYTCAGGSAAYEKASYKTGATSTTVTESFTGADYFDHMAVSINQNGGGSSNALTAAMTITNAGSVGIGTTSPNGELDVYGGHLLASRGGTAPAISSCGTSPTITGTDNSFKVTMGSGALTSCVINFGTTWTSAPNACGLTPANATAAATGTTGAYVSAISTTQVTITGANLTSAAYYIHCM